MTYSRTAKARFTVSSWDEDVVVDLDGEEAGTKAGDMYYPNRGWTTTRCVYDYTGDIEGRSLSTAFIAYKPDGAPFMGFEQITGSIDGHDGSFVLRSTGWQDAGSVRATLEVVPGLGTGGLETLRGEGEIDISGHSDDGYELVLNYDL
ncbi:MAG TPA: DUF3224 domain-containing protein [Nocardioides sp.]|nr:DUF3224 domain-containing protein [uncultured Nocardioides sp.]HEX5988114.1 DUF3224 domain-containing protein [Nocardioides sp.]